MINLKILQKKLERAFYNYEAKRKIKLFLWKYSNSIYNQELENIQEYLKYQNKAEIKNQIKLFIKKYWNVKTKDEIWEALYELITIFQEIDKNEEETE